MRSRIKVMLVLVCVACSGKAQHEPPATSTSSATDADAIRQMFAAFVGAKLARDVERQLSFVTDDPVYTPPGMPDVAGKAALRAWWTSREAIDSLESFELDPGEIVVVGNLAYSRGTSASRFRNRRTGQISNQEVRHLDILRRQPDGRWLISRHMRNSGPSTQAAGNDSSFLAFLPQWETAQSRFINGDPTSWKQSASHRPDATILGAFGGYGEKGWAVVGARYDWASSQYKESGATMRVEYLNVGVSGDLAFTVGIEHQTGARVAGQPSTRALRATQVFRREAGAWKLLHRHADPLVEKRAP